MGESKKLTWERIMEWIKIDQGDLLMEGDALMYWDTMVDAGHGIECSGEMRLCFSGEDKVLAEWRKERSRIVTN